MIDYAHISKPQAMEKMRLNGKNIPWYGSGQSATGRGITDYGRWRKIDIPLYATLEYSHP